MMVPGHDNFSRVSTGGPMDVAFALASFGFILGILLTKAYIQHLLTVVVTLAQCVCICVLGWELCWPVHKYYVHTTLAHTRQEQVIPWGTPSHSTPFELSLICNVCTSKRGVLEEGRDRDWGGSTKPKQVLYILEVAHERRLAMVVVQWWHMVMPPTSVRPSALTVHMYMVFWRKAGSAI